MNGSSVAFLSVRLKPLPSRHRAAHLRALIGLQPPDSGRRKQLVELLAEEMSGASDD
jgi:GcrA cell cycle regulator